VDFPTRQCEYSFIIEKPAAAGLTACYRVIISLSVRAFKKKSRKQASFALTIYITRHGGRLRRESPKTARFLETVFGGRECL